MIEFYPQYIEHKNKTRMWGIRKYIFAKINAGAEKAASDHLEDSIKNAISCGIKAIFSWNV